MAANTYTHTASGWTRTPLANGSMCQRITPTDDSGERIVRFLGRHDWQNDPADDKANQDTDRVVLISGAALPPWAVDWLTAANAKSCGRAREAFRAAIDDADNNSGW